jgi:V8-like Glu-specific endopeptidase
MKTFLVLLMMVSFKISFVQAQVLEQDRIIGANDLLLVKPDFSNIPAKFKSSMNAIGKLNSGCTVTHIGQGFAITAGHCFIQYVLFDENLTEHQSCSGDTIDWAWTKDAVSVKTSKCLEVVAIQRTFNGDIDFSIIKVSDAPKAKIDIDWNKKPRAGSFVTIFSYPGEAELSWSKYCRIKKLTSVDVMPHQMHHVCDTEAGSSGAAVLDIISGKIVALHTSGDGETLDDGTLTPAVENYAMYITQSPMKNLLIKSGYIIK